MRPQLGGAEREPVRVSGPDGGAQRPGGAATIAAGQPGERQRVRRPEPHACWLAGPWPGGADQSANRVRAAELEGEAGSCDPGVEGQLRPAAGVEPVGDLPGEREPLGRSVTTGQGRDELGVASDERPAGAELCGELSLGRQRAGSAAAG